MASVPGNEPLNVEEQIARIQKTLEEISRTRAEVRKIDLEIDQYPRSLQEQVARIDKTLEEISRTRAEVRKIEMETEYFPRSMIFQAMIATAALLGAGAAIAKLFFS